MLLPYYIHNMFGENILAKCSLKWNSGSIQEERGDTTYQARVEKQCFHSSTTHFWIITGSDFLFFTTGTLPFLTPVTLGKSIGNTTRHVSHTCTYWEKHTHKHTQSRTHKYNPTYATRHASVAQFKYTARCLYDKTKIENRVKLLRTNFIVLTTYLTKKKMLSE